MAHTVDDVIIEGLRQNKVIGVTETPAAGMLEHARNIFSVIFETMNEVEGMGLEWPEDQIPSIYYMPLALMVGGMCGPLYGRPGDLYQGGLYALRRVVFPDDRVEDADDPGDPKFIEATRARYY